MQSILNLNILYSDTFKGLREPDQQQMNFTDIISTSTYHSCHYRLEAEIITYYGSNGEGEVTQLSRSTMLKRVRNFKFAFHLIVLTGFVCPKAR